MQGDGRGDGGMDLDLGDALVRKHTASRNLGTGVFVTGLVVPDGASFGTGDANTFEGSTANDSVGDGLRLELGSGNDATGDEAAGNGNDGLDRVSTGSLETVVDGNAFCGNGHEGLDNSGTGTTITNNTCSRHGRGAGPDIAGSGDRTQGTAAVCVASPFGTGADTSASRLDHFEANMSDHLSSAARRLQPPCACGAEADTVSGDASPGVGLAQGQARRVVCPWRCGDRSSKPPHAVTPRPQPLHPVAHHRLPCVTPRPAPPSQSPLPSPLRASPTRHAPAARSADPGVPCRLSLPGCPLAITAACCDAPQPHRTRVGREARGPGHSAGPSHGSSGGPRAEARTGGSARRPSDSSMARIAGPGVERCRDPPQVGQRRLSTTGLLTAGCTDTLALAGAAPSATATPVPGLVQLGVPFMAGSLVPSPDVIVTLTSNAAGALALTFAWPAGVPAGPELCFRFWIQVAGARHGLPASNALRDVAG